ncbi:MAG TPA: transporter substrate-binding domain-containing protein [Azospirillum sp.]|nr:transporter substrate-binding domain-containing protein [Azospirillum sp.]
MVRRVWLLGLTCLLGLLAGVPALADPLTRVRLVFSTDANPPRIMGEGTTIDWARPGVTLELLRLAAVRAGVEFAFERVPWKRGLFLVGTGEADGLFQASHLPDRMGVMAYPMKAGRPDPARALMEQRYVLYTRPGSPVTWDGARLTGADAPVGAISSYSVVDELTRLGIPVEEGKTQEHNLDKLVGGRIAAYAGLEAMTDALIAAHPGRYGRLVKVMPPLVAKPYYLVFSRAFYSEHRDLAERIWDAIAEVNASGEFAAIVRRYAD